MKLRTLSIFGAAMIVSLTACGGDDADDAVEGDGTETAPAVETTAPVTPPATTPMDSAALVDPATPMGDTMADTTARM